MLLQCRVGDVVRATTAYTLQMTYPPMQLMFGGKQQLKMHPHTWLPQLPPAFSDPYSSS